MAVTSAASKFRLEIGDIPAAYGLSLPRPDPDPEFAAVALFTEAEVAYFLAAHPSSVLLAVAAACDALAARFAQDVDTAEDGQSFKASQTSAMYVKLAATFRKRAATDVVPDSDVLPGAPIGRVPTFCRTTWQTRW